MNIDIVIGNPPYNRGIDIDFMYDGFNLCNTCCSFVVPAKWQTCADDTIVYANFNYKILRDAIVEHVREVVYYFDSAEVFRVGVPSGITCFVADKHEVYDKAVITNKGKHLNILNSKMIRSIRDRVTWHNVGYELLEYIKKYRKYDAFSFDKVDKNKRYKVFINDQLSLEGGWHIKSIEDPHFMTAKDKNVFVLGVTRLIDSNDENDKCPVIASSVAFSSDNINDCKNFIYWVQSKFVRFFILINISKLGSVVTNDYFRYVPEPLIDNTGEYDWKIRYNDEILYSLYGLDNDDAVASNGIPFRKIIDNVIRERSIEI